MTTTRNYFIFTMVRNVLDFVAANADTRCGACGKGEWQLSEGLKLKRCQCYSVWYCGT